MLDVAEAEACFHCGEPVPPDGTLSVDIAGRPRRVCCRGCQAVAEAIRGYGLENFYRYRDGVTPRPDATDTGPDPALYDDPSIQEEFVERLPDGSCQAEFILENLVCPACCWLVESQLGKLDGVTQATVNYTSHHAHVRWLPERIPLSRILGSVAALGYRAWPYHPDQDARRLERERRGHLRRLALAGLLGMQVMMFAFALYSGGWAAAEDHYREFFRWISLFLTLPVLTYSGAPFFRRAWRDLRLLRPGMDVPVALGMGIAFLASCRATVTGTGEIYFDSVVMFIFLLSLGRYLEFMAGKKSIERVASLSRILPAVATRLAGNGGPWREETVPVARLQQGDTVLVRPGETVPADGCVSDGVSSVDESILTGESLPVKKSRGEQVIGGSRNIDSPLQMRVEHVRQATLLARIHALLEQGRAERPAFVVLANRIAGWFVLAVLLAAAATAWYWHAVAPGRWIPITAALLIVTCPCALSLAMPAAFASSLAALMRHGVAVVRPDVLERLAGATHFVFDKTGTLTRGTLQLAGVTVTGVAGRAHCLAVAAALESSSEHPLARALLAATGARRARAEAIQSHPGEGISGMVDGRRYFLGSEAFIRDAAGVAPERELLQAAGSKTLAVLADDSGVLAVFRFSDEIRPGAAELMQRLHAAGRETLILSGDSSGLVAHLTRELGMDAGWARQTPQDKLRRIRALQEQGARVVMVGDGVNDAPVLAGADVSIAMGSGTDLSRASADIILLGNSLHSLAALLEQSRHTRAVIRENLVWAGVYNLLALPAAAAGLVLPWMAALGMSLSSLLVVLNSARLAR